MVKHPLQTLCRLSTKNRLLSAAGLILIMAILLGLTITQHKPNLNNVNVVKRDVGRHYLLPTNEQPALATITDTAKLTGSFFKPAKDGDKVLIYQKNQLAIIYRPSVDRIISVGPVSIDTPPTPTSK